MGVAAPLDELGQVEDLPLLGTRELRAERGHEAFVQPLALERAAPDRGSAPRAPDVHGPARCGTQ